MKLGAEKKGEVIALLVLLAVAGLLLWRSLAPAGPAAATPSAPAPEAGAGSGVVPANEFSLDPRLHLEKLAALRAHAYSGLGRNLFHFGAAPPPSPASLAAQRRAAEVARESLSGPRMPQGPPPPPPIPLKFYGFARSANLPEKVFLQFGQDSYVVEAGEVIAHRYQIEIIGKLSVRVKDLMTQSEQEIPLQRPAAN